LGGGWGRGVGGSTYSSAAYSMQRQVLKKWECAHLGRVRVDFPAIVLGLGPTYVYFVTALLDVFHGGNFQHIMDDGQKFHAISQQLLADAFTCRVLLSCNAWIV